MVGQNSPLGLGLEILPTGLGSKVGQNGPFYTTGVLKNFAIFAGKYLCWSLFLIKVFYREYYEIFKNTYFEEHCELLLLEEG